MEEKAPEMKMNLSLPLKVYLPRINFPNINVEIAKLEIENNDLNEKMKDYNSKIAVFETNYNNKADVSNEDFVKYCNLIEERNRIKVTVGNMNNLTSIYGLASIKNSSNELKLIEEMINAFVSYGMTDDSSLISINYLINMMKNRNNNTVIKVPIILPESPKYDINSSIRNLATNKGHTASINLFNHVLNMYNNLLKKQIAEITREVNITLCLNNASSTQYNHIISTGKLDKCVFYLLIE